MRVLRMCNCSGLGRVTTCREVAILKLNNWVPGRFPLPYPPRAARVLDGSPHTRRCGSDTAGLALLAEAVRQPDPDAIARALPKLQLKGFLHG